MYVDVVYTLVSSQDNDGSGWMATERATTLVIGVLHRHPHDCFRAPDRPLRRDRRALVAHGRIWPMGLKSQESAIEPAVDRSVDDAPTRERFAISLRPHPSTFLRRDWLRVMVAAAWSGSLNSALQTHLCVRRRKLVVPPRIEQETFDFGDRARSSGVEAYRRL